MNYSDDVHDLETQIMEYLNKTQTQEGPAAPLAPRTRPSFPALNPDLCDLALNELQRRHRRLEEVLMETTEWQARTLDVAASHIQNMLKVLENAGLPMDPKLILPKILKVVEGNLDEVMAVMNDELDDVPDQPRGERHA